MANNNNISINLQIQAQEAYKELNKLTQQAKQALNPNSPGFQKQADAIKEIEKRLSQASQSAIHFAKQGEQGAAAFVKVTNEAATLTKRLRDLTTDQDTRNKLIEKEVQLRKQANEAAGGSGNFLSPHSERQNATLQKMLGGSGGDSATSLLAGKASAAITATVGILESAFKELGQAAEETARTVRDAGGQFDQLRMSETLKDFAKSKASDSAGAAHYQQLQNQLEARFWGGVETVLNGLDKAGKALSDFGKTTQQVSDENKNALMQSLKTARDGTPLAGDAKIGLDNLTRSQEESEQDMAMERQQYEHDIAATRRDLALENMKMELEYARKKEDIERDAAIEQRDYQIQTQKIVDDKAFQSSEKKRQVDLEARQRDFTNSQQDKAVDYNLKRQYNAQDFANSQADSAQDFADETADMAANGASGLSYLQHARDFRKKQARAARNFSIQQSRDATQFGLDQYRNQRDFQNSTKDEAAKHAIDVDQHRYEVGQQLLEVENKHKDALEKTRVELERWKQDLAIARQEMKNRQGDVDFNDQMARKKMDINQQRTERGYDESFQDYANSLYKQDPYGFINKMKADPRLADWFNKRQARAGENWGFDMSKINGQQAQAAKDYQNQEKANASPAGFSGDVRQPGGPEFPKSGDESAALAKYKDQLTPTQWMELNSVPLDKARDMLKSWGITPSFAAGGQMLAEGYAYLHPGEYVINPNGDHSRQLGLLGQAANALLPASMMNGQTGGGANVNLGGVNVQAGLPADIQPMLQQMMSQFGSQVSSTVQAAMNKWQGSMIRGLQLNEQNRRFQY